MNRAQRVVVASRDRGRHRVGQVTRWTAAAGALTLAVIGVVLAQGPASAAAPVPAKPDPTHTPPPQVSPPQHSRRGSHPPGLTSPNVSQYGSPSFQGLQPPPAVPQYSFSGGSHASSGAS